jgi:hypothetical protein
LIGLSNPKGDPVMRRSGLIVGAVATSFLAMPADAALVVSATDSVGGPVTLACTAGTGTLACTGSDANFTTVEINVTGVPAVPSPDLGTVTLDVTSATGGTHVLSILATQDGLSFGPGANSTTADTFDGLIGSPGPVDYQMFINGVLLNKASLGPPLPVVQEMTIANDALPAITSDAEGFRATFTAAGQDLEATMEFAAATAVPPAVPEPTSLTLLGAALVGMGWVVRPRRKTA